MWYVIQTVTGQEDVLTDMMQKIIPEEYYRECFYIKRECADKEGDGMESLSQRPVPWICVRGHGYAGQGILQSEKRSETDETSEE